MKLPEGRSNAKKRTHPDDRPNEQRPMAKKTKKEGGPTVAPGTIQADAADILAPGEGRLDPGVAPTDTPQQQRPEATDNHRIPDLMLGDQVAHGLGDVPTGLQKGALLGEVAGAHRRLAVQEQELAVLLGPDDRLWRGCVVLEKSRKRDV